MSYYPIQGSSCVGKNMLDFSVSEKHSVYNKHQCIYGSEFLAELSKENIRDFKNFGFTKCLKIPYEKIHYAIEAVAKLNPESIAVEHLSDCISYGELNRKAEFLANLLLQKGVVPGDCIGLYLRRSIPMVVGILAILKAGAAYVPQDVSLAPEKQLKYVSESAGIKIVLTQRKFISKVPLVKNQEVLGIEDCLDAYDGQVPSDIPYAVFPRCELSGAEHACFVIYTSGTTGKPNGAMVSHKNVCNLLLSSPGDLGMAPGVKVSQILNIAFDMAAWEILGCLSHGATLCIRGSCIESIMKEADIVIATPSILGKIDSRICSNVKTIAVAGEPCPKSLADSWSKNANFYNCCGPTETTIVNTMKLYNPIKSELTIGTPTPNNTVYVLNDNMMPCEIGEVGEMWAGGACVTLGYINNAELTKSRYKPDPFLGGDGKMFRTKDLGRWTSSGELEHLGRADDQVKIKGFRVELDSVSSVLEKMDECRHAVTLKIDNQTLVSFVSPLTCQEEDAKKIVAESLPYYCVPSRVFLLSSLPITDRGKVDKRKLHEIVISQLLLEQSDQEYMVEETSCMETLV